MNYKPIVRALRWLKRQPGMPEKFGPAVGHLGWIVGRVTNSPPPYQGKIVFRSDERRRGLKLMVNCMPPTATYTLRFLVRPSDVPLSAIGLVWPYHGKLMRAMALLLDVMRLQHHTEFRSERFSGPVARITAVQT